MASLADIFKMVDEKLAVARKETVDDLQTTFLHKIEADMQISRSRQQPTRLLLQTSRSRPQPTRLPLHA
jgi:hypothetical protein